MQAQSRDGRRLWLLTLTAPGERAHDRWTPAERYVRGAKRPECSCHVGFSLAVWNPSASACWNRLRTSLTRQGVADVQYYRAAEVQDGKRGGTGRGALHHHVVMATRGLVDVNAVQQLALAAGYGCVLDLQPVQLGADFSDLAAYVSKRLAGYVSKSSGENRLEVPWFVEYIDPETGELKRWHTVPTYKTHSQSSRWGMTVREVKAVAQAQARRRSAALADCEPDWAPDGTPLGPDSAAGAEAPT